MIDRTSFHPSRLVIGIFLILVGAFALADNLDLVEVDVAWRLWPLLLVGLGVVKLLFPGDRGERWGGAWLLMVGCWAAVSSWGWLGLSWHSSWPLLLIGVGGLIAARAVLGGDDRHPEASHGR